MPVTDGLCWLVELQVLPCISSRSPQVLTWRQLPTRVAGAAMMALRAMGLPWTPPQLPSHGCIATRQPAACSEVTLGPGRSRHHARARDWMVFLCHPHKA